ncbi:MAG: tRNA pseudouridine(55) synthase TruB [Armatimonadetes bacterium]|nr:tRNA pseudouridine(55) synthase TruB [Armatimonadota bacterium]
MLGIVLIDKPKGITSHDVVSRLRRRFQTKRIGHAGTLDPLATGLLVLAVGPATRFLQYLPLEPKEYISTFKFGQTTNTFDAEGEVTQTRSVPANLEAAIAHNIDQFRGEIQQTPPMYSAVKVNGQPLYKYARKGEEVEVKSRTVFIEEMELLEINGDEAEFRIVCSGGTYIRTLAHDLGEAIGCGAYISQLARTQVGEFDIEDAVTLEDVGESDLIPLSKALKPMPLERLNPIQIEYVRNGRQIQFRHSLTAKTIGLTDQEGNVIGIGHVVGNMVQPECIIPAEVIHGTV